MGPNTDANTLEQSGANPIPPFVYRPLAGNILFGLGASRHRLIGELERLGSKRVLAVVGQHARPLAAELMQPLGRRAVGVYAGAQAHVPLSVAEEGRARARELGADCLVSIGGGSTTGVAKAIALELELPIVAVPTTYSGSEMTPIYGITSANRKQTGLSLRVLPRVVVYDPELTVSLPASITGPSAMNALAHCVEALTASGANPVTTVIAKEGIVQLKRGAPVCVANPADLAGRSTTLYGACLAATALASAGTGLHHMICHVLGGTFGLPHAETHAALLPHVVAFRESADPSVTRQVADALEAGTASRGLVQLAARLGAPASLRAIGMREDDVDVAVAAVVEAASSDGRQSPGQASVRQILEGAFAGPPTCL